MEKYDSNGKKWILSKYAKLILQNPTDPNSSYWKNLDSSQCDSPIYITIKPTNYLQINYDKEYLEFINLWDARDDMKLYYKDKSFIVVHKMKTFVRKFRVQFFDDPNGQTATKSCESCVCELSKFICTEAYDSLDASKQSKGNIAQTNAAAIDEDSSTVGKESCTLRDMTKILIANNEHKLPLFYSGKSSTELLNDNKEDKVLEEFIVNCLLDPTFVPFVNKVQSVLNNIVTKELHSDS